VSTQLWLVMPERNILLADTLARMSRNVLFFFVAKSNYRQKFCFWIVHLCMLLISEVVILSFWPRSVKIIILFY